VESEILVLAATAASIGFVHTVLGPDHYLPFIVLGRARAWSRAKIAAITTLCGLGHVAGSVALGAVGIAIGLAVGRMELIESVRGELAAWALMGFGLAYAAWGWRRAQTGRAHSHAHVHADGTAHAHCHDHRGGHVHVHESEASAARLTPWVLFTVFVLGPCEPLIPLLMVPAAAHSWAGVAFVAGVFGLATIATMLAVVFAGLAGLSVVSFTAVERHAHTLAGTAVAACGAAMVFLGL
jgi:hypothetical protein